jgi:hypothetical protein
MSSKSGIRGALSSVGTLSIAAILLTGLSAKAESFKGCYGAKYTYMETLEIAEGHSLTIFRAFGTGYVLEDSKSPFNGLSGPCIGSVEIRDGAMINQLAKCIRTDKDGDKVLIIGGATSDNLTTGTFDIEGLTGKFAGVKGSGTWRDTANDAEYYHTCFEATYTRE